MKWAVFQIKMVDTNATISTLLTSTEKNLESDRSLLFEYLRKKSGRNLEPFSLVWYDAHVSNIEENKKMQYEL